MAEQTRQAFANLRTCLEAAGAEVTDIVKWAMLVEIEAVATVRS